MLTTEEIRKAMRITHASLDEEIRRNMDTCLLDMERVGIDTQKKKDDILIGKACELYCKAQFDYQGKGAAYQQNYEKLRDAISLSEGYKNVR